MKRLVPLPSKSSDHDIWQFGLSYWLASLYVTIIAVVLDCCVLSLEGFMALAILGSGALLASLSASEAAAKSADRNAKKGSFLAALISFGGIFALVLRHLHQI